MIFRKPAIIASLLLLAVAAKAEWIQQPAPGDTDFKCSAASSDDPSAIPVVSAGVVPVVWKNQTNLFAICSEPKITPGTTGMTLSSNFEIKAVLNGTSVPIASEGEIGGKPRRVEFKGNDILISEYLSKDAPIILTQSIRCRSAACQLSKPSCAIVEPKTASVAATQLSDRLRRSDASRRLEIWKDYFFDGKHIATGNAIILEAMLGNPTARQAVSFDVGADGGPAEVQEQYQDDIDEVAKYCAKPTSDRSSPPK